MKIGSIILLAIMISGCFTLNMKKNSVNEARKNIIAMVDSLTFEVLEYDSKVKFIDDTITQSSHGVVLKTSFSDNQSPLLVINRYPVQNLKLLEHIYRDEVRSITIVEKGNEGAVLYGERGRFGVIIIEVSTMNFDWLWKKYGS